MSRPAVGLACSPAVRETYLAPADLARLGEFADFRFAAFDGGSDLRTATAPDRAEEARLREFTADLDALLLCHGAPLVTAAVLADSRLRLIGDLEGDRFGTRIDVPAARERRITLLDTTHGSSMGVAEWALGLALIGLRDAGARFRRLIAHQPAGPGLAGNRELTGRPVSLIGFGHIGRRLVELLGPFGVDVLAYDPFVPPELAAAYRIGFADLPRVLEHGDVVFCLLPLTPATRGRLGAHELARLRAGSVFVNVSRGAVVDSDALLARLSTGDIYGALDVFDPEPIPTDAAVRDLPNVFLSPHIAGVTQESRTAFFRFMVDELRLFFDGRRPTAELTDAVLAARHGRIEP